MSSVKNADETTPITGNMCFAKLCICFHVNQSFHSSRFNLQPVNYSQTCCLGERRTYFIVGLFKSPLSLTVALDGCEERASGEWVIN